MAHDVVLAGGRVLDPETGFDRVCDVGIDGDSVTAVGVRLVGTTTVDMSAGSLSPLVFVDLHSHAQTLPGRRLQGVRRAAPPPGARPPGAAESCTGRDRLCQRGAARFPDQLRLLGVVGGRAHARACRPVARRGAAAIWCDRIFTSSRIVDVSAMYQ